MQSGYQRVLVPVSGSPSDVKALELVGDMASRRPVDLTLVYVVEVQQAMPLDAELPEEIDRGEAALSSAEERARLILGPKHERLGTDLLQARSAGAAIVDVVGLLLVAGISGSEQRWLSIAARESGNAVVHAPV